MGIAASCVISRILEGPVFMHNSEPLLLVQVQSAEDLVMASSELRPRPRIVVGNSLDSLLNGTSESGVYRVVSGAVDSAHSISPCFTWHRTSYTLVFCRSRSRIRLTSRWSLERRISISL